MNSICKKGVNKLIKYLKDRFFYSKGYFLLGAKKFDIIEKVCLDNLALDKDNYLYLDLITHCYYYMRKSEKCFYYFKLWLETNKIRDNVIIFFLDEIIGRLNGGEQFDETIKYGMSILNLIKNRKPRILLLKYLSVAYYRKEQYDLSLSTINEIGKLNPKEKQLDEKRNEVLEKINETRRV